ncbi:hypothetical protein SAMN04488023_11417 [Pedobacter rhizosphaerae]|uniref:Uncharacterized protein n=1 Tax=Pedobacter rhizosphaerae TaxID=390241 RepID=A0A1H9RAW0_9SPHI|nr:hypothetical protein SAMN04488023_11417 [Pedobacter rhizosphaerae]
MLSTFFVSLWMKALAFSNKNDIKPPVLQFYSRLGSKNYIFY